MNRGVDIIPFQDETADEKTKKRIFNAKLLRKTPPIEGIFPEKQNPTHRE